MSTYGDQVKPPLPNPIEAFQITTAAGSYLVQVIYIILAVFALKLLWQDRHERGTWWKAILVLLGLATPILAFKGALDPFPVFPNDLGVFIAIACIVIAAVWYAVLHFTRPEQVRNAARHAVEHHGVPALVEPIPQAAPGATA